MVELKKITKYFPANGVQALEEGNFILRPGEIHALLGENGAGKSTLMHILAGYLPQSSGEILAEGERRRFNSPAQALASGIGMVRQRPSPAPGFKVWEECALGMAKGSFFLKKREIRRRVRDLIRRWDLGLNPDSPSESLTISQRQKAAVLAMLFRGEVPYLVFDEPGAVLTPGETASLFALLKRLREEGRGIVLISHKLDETLGIADRITVIRRGRTLESGEAASYSHARVSALIFGSAPAASPDGGAAAQAGDEKPGSRREAAGDEAPKIPALEVRDLSVELPGRPFIRGISMEIPPGKILGIAGVRDSGLETLELGITGFLKPSGPGFIRLNGRDIAGKGSGAFREAGGVYLEAGRSGEAAGALAIRESLIIHCYKKSRLGWPGKFGVMDERYLRGRVDAILRRARISRSSRDRADSFSGGMLQRLFLARELEEEGVLLVLSEPGWGLDRISRDRLGTELRARRKEGKGILIFSTDVDELLEICDEILVLRNGIFSARLVLGNREEMTRTKEEIGRAMVGA